MPAEGPQGVQIEDQGALAGPAKFAAAPSYPLLTVRVPIRELKTMPRPRVLLGKQTLSGISRGDKNKFISSPNEVRRHLSSPGC